MAKSYKSYKSLLKTKLEGLMDSGTPPARIFDYVYDYEEAKPMGYPCAYILQDAGNGSIIDTERNQREWQFKIVLKQEISKVGKTPEQAEDILTDVVDKVIESFDTDPQLLVSNVAQCMYCRVTPVEFDFSMSDTAQIFATFIICIVDIVKTF
jgi:hypothetical protein